MLTSRLWQIALARLWTVARFANPKQIDLTCLFGDRACSRVLDIAEVRDSPRSVRLSQQIGDTGGEDDGGEKTPQLLRLFRKPQCERAQSMSTGTPDAGFLAPRIRLIDP